MPIGLLFWILMVIWFAFWLIGRWNPHGPPWINDVFLFILFFLLGWKIFGFVLHA